GRFHARSAGGRNQRACQRAAKARSNGRGRPLPGRHRRRRAAGRSGVANGGKGMRVHPLPPAPGWTGDESMKPPSDIGPIHFVGIGGIGMSGIAEVLINLGYTVQGSDASDSANVKRLRDKGAKVSIGHSAGALGDAEVVVVSTAIKRDNPELTAAR